MYLRVILGQLYGSNMVVVYSPSRSETEEGPGEAIDFSCHTSSIKTIYITLESLYPGFSEKYYVNVD